MRKLIIKSAFVAAFIVVAGYTAYNTQKMLKCQIWRWLM